jgi:hypothetical protein
MDTRWAGSYLTELKVFKDGDIAQSGTFPAKQV